MRKFTPDELPVDKSLLEDSPIKGELNVEQLVFRQIERTYMSALQDESLFASNVRLLLSTVPIHKRLEVLAQQDEYTSYTESYQYKYCCGVPMGTPEEPIDGSPTLIEDEVIDWHKLFEIILAALEDCGLTWKFDRWTIEAGAVEEPVQKSSPVPTPVFEADFANPKPTDKVQTPVVSVKDLSPPKYVRPCAICKQHVDPGTGKFYQHKIVHKKECLDLAKAQWVADNP